jgi:phosphoesterase RecJ-like protein
MIPAAALQKIQALITKGRRFVLTTHVNPDGDSIGCEIALAQYLQQLGKSVSIFNHSVTPENYEFLDPLGDIQLFETDQHAEVVRQSDAIFILDISDWQRLRELGKLLQEMSIPKICLDHHPRNQPFADLDVIHPQASSTGELIYELLTSLHAKIEGRMAQALYTAVMTDTGSFRFSNTTPGAHQVAAALLAAGVEPNLIYQNVYESQPPNRMKLLAHILSHLNYEARGRLVWFVVTQEVMQSTGTQPRDTEGFADFPRTIAGVEISLMFMATKDGKVKISFRSKGRYVINGLANRFGGGGHAYAAGALVDGTLQEIVPRVLEEVKELFAGNK